MYTPKSPQALRARVLQHVHLVLETDLYPRRRQAGWLTVHLDRHHLSRHYLDVLRLAYPLSRNANLHERLIGRTKDWSQIRAPDHDGER